MGELTARLKAAGTLQDPSATLDLKLDDLGLSGGTVGGVQAHYRYARASHDLKALLTSKGGGKLKLDASAKLDVSQSALKRGLEFAHSRSWSPRWAPRSST